MTDSLVMRENWLQSKIQFLSEIKTRENISQET
ncbi:hypothetical protein CIFRMM088M_24380 [Citrobacter freundii]